MLSDQTILLLGGAAAALQVVGYLLYIRNDEIEPNPVTWLMFAYGTLLLTVLEWDMQATLADLMLPAVCSMMALWVAARCWMRSYRMHRRAWPREWWPEDWRDRMAFQLDLALTGSYLAAAALLSGNWIGPEASEAATLVLLTAANVTTVSAFCPLIRSVLEDPGHERTLPWAVWAAAYSVLALTTLAAHGGQWSELMLYPTLNAFLHGLVAFLSRETRRDLVTRHQAIAA